MKKTLILGLIAMMALMANAQDSKSCCGEKKCKTEKCDKKADKCDKKCSKKNAKCEKKQTSKSQKKTDAQTGATKQK